MTKFTTDFLTWLKGLFYTKTEVDTKLTEKSASDHVHGDITNDGKVGSVANKPLITGTNGAVTTGSFGTTANTFSQGNHTHGNLQNDGQVGATAQASKNVVTDSNGKLTTEDKPTIPTGSSTATDIKMDGTQSAGSSSNFAKADHVHPTDTSRAPVDHASANTDYGVGSASNYGHVKVDAAPTSSSTNAVASGGVDSALALKQNEVETQSKVVKFVNKDRINIERLLNYMEKGSSGNYYTLDLIGKFSETQMNTSSASSSDIWSDEKDRLAIKTHTVGSIAGHYMCFGGLVYKNGVAQPNNTDTITFKLTDGTVLGIATLKRDSSISGGDYRFYQANYRDGLFDTPGIYYVYGECTIAGSVVKSNILTVFVKENQNLLSYNQWSCGDYTNDLTDFEQEIICKITNEYSTQGENSVQIGRTSTYYWVDIPFTVSSIGEYTAQLKLRGEPGYMRIMHDETIIAQVGTPRTNEWKTVSLSANITSLTGNHIRVLNYFGDIFIDDVSLTSS